MKEVVVEEKQSAWVVTIRVFAGPTPRPRWGNLSVFNAHHIIVANGGTLGYKTDRMEVGAPTTF